jgi:hypothetical protein
MCDMVVRQQADLTAARQEADAARAAAASGSGGAVEVARVAEMLRSEMESAAAAHRSQLESLRGQAEEAASRAVELQVCEEGVGVWRRGLRSLRDGPEPPLPRALVRSLLRLPLRA